MLSHWLAPTRRSPRPRFRPHVERLDDRLAPAVFTVSTAGDAGPGSLRQAILDANAAPGADDIRFAVGAEGSSHTVQPLTQLPNLTDAITLDGWSQGGPGYRGLPLVTLDGTAVPTAYGLKAFAPDCTIRGLSIGGFAAGIVIWGPNATVQGCHVGVDAAGTVATPNHQGIGGFGANLRIGGTGPGEGNVISGALQATNVTGDGIVIEGNKVGTDVTGTKAIPGSRNGLIVSGAGGRIGGTAAGAGNLISGHEFDGVIPAITTGLVIQGNIIGMDVTGLVPLPNGYGGIDFFGPNRFSTDMLIGGTTPGSRNVISGNGLGGIRGSGDRVTIQGNFIGPDAAGGLLPADDNRHQTNGGVTLGGSGNLIGGADPAAANRIAGNGRHGVYLEGTSGRVEGNVIRDNARLGFGAGPYVYGAGVVLGQAAAGFSVLRNSITNNGWNGAGLGIDIGPNDTSHFGDGVTPNDPLDADAGPNGVQNFPVLSAATCAAVTGALSSTPNRTFRIEFFANTATDPSGHGEGERYLGFAEVTTDAAGNAAFATPSFPLAVGEKYLTATATDLATGSTSEFSNAVTANVAPTAGVTGPAAGVRGQALAFTLTAADPDSAGPFTFAIDWDGNGVTDQTVVGPSGTAVEHVYPAAGGYTVRVTATDGPGCTSPVVTLGVAVQVAMLQPDPCDPGKQALVVGGTTGKDDINLSPASGAVEVRIGGSLVGTFAPTGRLVVFAQGGDDDVTVAGGIGLPAWLYGGDGDDRLKGGGGNDVLLGETGADLLVGSSGRDLLIGGTGADRIVGNADDDLLIAGVTAFDRNPAGLCAVMAEWTRTDRTAAERVAALLYGGGRNGGMVLNGTTVSSDTDADVLTGSSGFDWFLFDSTRDRVTDLHDEAFTTDLPFIGE